MLVISNGRAISEKRIGNDVEGSGRGLIQLRRLPGETENTIDFREDSLLSGQDFKWDFRNTKQEC
jgi:hypothetical protein